MPTLRLSDVRAFCEKSVLSLDVSDPNPFNHFHFEPFLSVDNNFDPEFDLVDKATTIVRCQKPWPPTYNCQDHGWEAASGITEVGRRLVLLLFGAGLSTTILGIELDQESGNSTTSDLENSYFEQESQNTTQCSVGQMDHAPRPSPDLLQGLFICRIMATISVEDQRYEAYLHFELQLKDGFDSLAVVPHITQDIVSFIKIRIFYGPSGHSETDSELDEAICEAFKLRRILCSVDGYSIDLEPNRLMARGYEGDERGERDERDESDERDEGDESDESDEGDERDEKGGPDQEQQL